MSLNFTIPELNIGGAGTPPLEFFRRGFNLGGSGSQPTWRDVILSGNTALTLVNAKANGLNYLKLFGECTQNALPQGYTQLDSIHLDGGCYFNTSVVIDSLDAYTKLIASFDTQSSASPCMMWGFMGSSNSLPRWGVGLYSSKYLMTPNATGSAGTPDTNRHTFITYLFDDSGTTKYSCLVDGSAISTSTLSIPDTISGNELAIFIGARNNNGTASNYIKGNFTYFELQQGGVVKAKIYPCKRNYDNTLGLYNTITNEFLTNQGSGTITAGSTTLTPSPNNPIDIVCNNGTISAIDDELPSGYRRLLGYTCDNNTLWQITNFKLRGSDTVRISFSVSAACNVFGCYQGTDATDNYDLYVSTTSGSKYLRYGSGTFLSYWSSSNLDKRFDVVFTPNGTSGMPSDSTWSPQTFESVNDLLIGATTLTGTSAKLKGDLYGNFIVDNRLKLIPCERASDGSLGYYDTYSETFFEPTGTPTSLGYDSSHYILDISGTTETVQVHSVNVFDKTKEGALMVGFPAADGKWNESLNFRSTCCKLSEGKTYTITRVTSNPTSAAMRVIAYDEVPTNAYYGTALFVGNNTDKTATITVPTGKPYIVTYVKHSADSITDQSLLDGFQIELGSTATDYQPYWVGDTATAEMLLKLLDKGGNSIYAQDIQNVTTGEVTRNVGIKVFDGTETWTRGTNKNASDHYVFYTSLTDRKNADTSIGMLSTHYVFKGTVSYATTTTGEFCILQSGTTVYFDGVGYTTVDDFKAYLTQQYVSGTPVIVVYPLATPTTETVTGQPLTIQAGTNVVEITQASIDNLELEVSYKAGVEVTVTEIENAQLDNSVEVTIS